MPDTDFIVRGNRIRASIQPLDHKTYYPEAPEALWDAQTVQTVAALGEGSLIDPRGSLNVDIDLSPSAGTPTGTVQVWVWNETAGTFVMWAKYDFDTADSHVIRVDVAGRLFQPILTALSGGTMSAWVVRL